MEVYIFFNVRTVVVDEILEEVKVGKLARFPSGAINKLFGVRFVDQNDFENDFEHFSRMKTAEQLGENSTTSMRLV